MRKEPATDKDSVRDMDLALVAEMVPPQVLVLVQGRELRMPVGPRQAREERAELVPVMELVPVLELPMMVPSPVMRTGHREPRPVSEPVPLFEPGNCPGRNWLAAPQAQQAEKAE